MGSQQRGDDEKPDKFAPDFYQVDFSDMFLPIIVVTKDPKDYPGKVVGRVWEGKSGLPSNLVVVRDTLEQLRETIPTHRFVCAGRKPNDDPVIVECWL